MTQDRSEILDKERPNYVDFEESLIGAIIFSFNKTPLLDELPLVIPSGEVFYDPTYQTIYNTALEIHQSGQKLDIVILARALKQLPEVQQVAYTLAKSVQTGLDLENAQYYAGKILDAYIHREIIEASVQNIRDADHAHLNNESTEQLRARVVDRIGEATEYGISDQIERIGVEVCDMVDEILAGKKPQQAAISSGISALDEALNGGFHPTQSIVVAALPSVGKSMLALSFALHAAQNEVGVAMFSLEMSRREISERALSNVSRLSRGQFEGIAANNRLKLSDPAVQILEMPLYVEDRSNTTVEEIIAKIRMLKRKHGIKLAVIDYLQLITASDPKQTNRQMQIAHITKRLKQAAQDNEIAIISLAQLNRSAVGGKPQNQHLRGAGDIENDANTVLMLWQEEGTSQGNATEPCKLSVTKNRSGQRDIDFDLQFFKSECRFEEQATYYTHAEELDRLNQFEGFNSGAAISVPQGPEIIPSPSS